MLMAAKAARRARELPAAWRFAGEFDPEFDGYCAGDVVRCGPGGVRVMNPDGLWDVLIDRDMVLSWLDLESLKPQDGADGRSAYELAVQEGFSGDQQQWLQSLRGTDGDSVALQDVVDECCAFLVANAEAFRGDTGADCKPEDVAAAVQRYIEQHPIENILAPAFHQIARGAQQAVAQACGVAEQHGAQLRLQFREKLEEIAKTQKVIQGPMGPMPRHEWKGTKIRFEVEPGKWGRWVELGGQTATVVAGFDVATESEPGVPRLQFQTATPINSYKAVTTDADGKLIYADAGNSEHVDQVVGVSLQSASVAGGQVDVADSGVVQNDGWNWIAQKPVFLGLGGDLTQLSGAGVFHLQVGFAKSQTELFVRLGRGILRA